MSKKKKLFLTFAIFILLFLIIVVIVFGINSFVVRTTFDRIISPEKAAELEGFDAILVLGCQVKDDGKPSHMLADRLKRGIELYNVGAAPKMLMSGDHGREEYDEVNVMKDYAVARGVPSEDVFMDHAGFSTYESLFRARDVFCADKVIIVTQEYHLYRALYIAEKLGIDAYGVSCDYRTYYGQFMREIREILARDKDFIKLIFRPEPTFLGDEIPVSGNGDLTND